MNPERIPVVVGGGQINDREDRFDSRELAEAALRAADEDAGGGWLPALDQLRLVRQISFPELGDFATTLAEQICASGANARTTAAPNGDSPIRILNKAAQAILAGRARVVAVAGGEALRTAMRRPAAQHSDPLRRRSASGLAALRHAYGLVAPTDIYPLYENATRAAWKQSLAEAQAESALLWSGMAHVAAATPSAWLREPLSPADILADEPANRPIAFPYRKRMVANAAVNQGAAFIVTSLADARRRGVAEDRLAYVGAGAAAHEPDELLERNRFDQTVSMAVSLERTLALNGLMPDECGLLELYSCFPCVPKLARRVLGLPVERPITMFGGLTFGGGPIGNYMSHVVACALDGLRDGARHALLFGNGGFATHNHSIVLSRDPAIATRASAPFDYQAEADAQRAAPPPFAAEYQGAATIETFTVLYGRDGQPRQGVIVARTLDNRRTLALVPGADAELIALLTDGKVEPIGLPGFVRPTGDQQRWTPA